MSPCNSQHDIAATQSQMILLQAQEIATEIIGKAIELHEGLDIPDSNESLVEDSNIGLTANESQFLFETRDLVKGIIERALEVNEVDSLAKSETVVNSDAVIAIFDAVDPEKGFTPIQSQIFFKAKEMVHAAVARAIVINSGLATMNSAEVNESGFSRLESELVMTRAQDIVDKVIMRAMKLNLEMMEEGRSSSAAVSIMDHGGVRKSSGPPKGPKKGS